MTAARYSRFGVYTGLSNLSAGEYIPLPDVPKTVSYP